MAPPLEAPAPAPEVDPAMVLASEDETTEPSATDDGADEGALDDDVDDIIEEAPPQNGERDARRFQRHPRLRHGGGLLAKIERVFRIEERFDLVVRIEHPKSGRAPSGTCACRLMRGRVERAWVAQVFGCDRKRERYNLGGSFVEG